MDKLLAFFAATTFIFSFALITLDKKQMTGIVYAVHVGVGRFAALMTMGYDLIRYSFTQSLIKHKIFSMKFIGQPLFLYLVSVMNDTPFQMKNIFESFVEHKG